MTFTIGNWVVFGFVFLFLAAGVTKIWAYCKDSYSYVGPIIATIIAICIMVGVVYFVGWYNKNTASGQRNVKDFQSNIQGGLEREITITAEDGREIFRYEGKVDIETKHEGNANYILFESEEGLRYIIYYGVQDTVLIIEKGE